MTREQYQTVKEVADLLKVNEASVRNWIKSGQLRAIEIGKGWRVADSDLEAFLCSHSTRAKDITHQEDEASQGGDSEHES
ncbi:helix-turn-helix domain protein [Antarctobacter heliothermus]|uniref:Helix-turn-helix domain protein n=1 Tax=Antarctobacter heliothermus TaxID=74033 RepID=A0A222E2H6_9RHOB|nr:helix-turn-helix domain-containing protein [Antarctobacter heliothermus]ASP20405.1 helix-turn-helix domain protein [Antarctobacter heliothermus]MBT56795.1 DNA-binding protein [Mameliella sp.]|tara:strand:- start:3364 stop:3603 length:240 start_codon:yes stop_codon:yes gene_type:complete